MPILKGINIINHFVYWGFATEACLAGQDTCLSREDYLKEKTRRSLPRTDRNNRTTGNQCFRLMP